MKNKTPRSKKKLHPYEVARAAVPREIRRVVFFQEVHGQCVPWMRVNKNSTDDGAITIEQAVERFGLSQGTLRAMWLETFAPFTDYKDREDIERRYPGKPININRRPADSGEDISFHPELMDWLEPGFGKPPPGTPDGIPIYDTGDEGKHFVPREWLFTIVVNPKFSPAMANKMAMLASRAPALWRELRECVTHNLNCIDWWPAKQSGIEELMYSAKRWPFEYLKPDKPEEELITRCMEMRQALRLEKTGGSDAKQ